MYIPRDEALVQIGAEEMELAVEEAMERGTAGPVLVVDVDVEGAPIPQLAVVPPFKEAVGVASDFKPVHLGDVRRVEVVEIAPVVYLVESDDARIGLRRDEGVEGGAVEDKCRLAAHPEERTSCGIGEDMRAGGEGDAGEDAEEG